MNRGQPGGLPAVVTSYIQTPSIDNTRDLLDWLDGFGNPQAAQVIQYLLEMIISLKADADLLTKLNRALKEALDKLMEKPTNQTNITGSNVGQVGHNVVKDSTIHGSVGVTQTFENCFNRIQGSGASEDLKKLLTQLHTQMKQLGEKMPESEAKTKALGDYQTLVTEATSAKPRRKWLELSAEGIKEAAQTVKEIAAPILATVGLILTFFAGLT